MATQEWNFDNAHSEIGFTVRHMMFAKVNGSFDEWTGSFRFDPENPEQAMVKASIEANSINTRNEQRDEHLRSHDFLDIANNPTIEFESTRWEQKGDDFLVHGDLTIRGVTKPVVLEVAHNGTGIDPWGHRRVGFSASAKINRKDFGVEWNQALEAGGVLVGDEVKVNLEVQAVEAEASESSAAE